MSERPLDATDEEMCKKTRDTISSDRRIKVEEIAQALGILHGSVSTILHDCLGMRKLTARWVPEFLSDEQMAIRVSERRAFEAFLGQKMIFVPSGDCR